MAFLFHSRLRSFSWRGPLFFALLIMALFFVSLCELSRFLLERLSLFFFFLYWLCRFLPFRSSLDFCYHAMSLLFSNFVQHCRNLTKRCSGTIPAFFEIFWTIFLLYLSRSSEKAGKLKNKNQIYQCIMGSNVSWYYSKALQANIILINKIITAETKPWYSPKLSNSNSAIIKILYKVGYINLPCTASFSSGLIKTSRKYGIASSLLQ